MSSKAKSFIGEKERVSILGHGTANSDGLHLCKNSSTGIRAFSSWVFSLPEMRGSYRSGVRTLLRMLWPMSALVWNDEARTIEEIEKCPAYQNR